MQLQSANSNLIEEKTNLQQKLIENEEEFINLNHNIEMLSTEIKEKDFSIQNKDSIIEQLKNQIE